MHGSTGVSLHLIIHHTLPVASADTHTHTCWGFHCSRLADCLRSDCMLPWDNTVTPPFLLPHISRHTMETLCTLSRSVRCVYGGQEEDMRLPVWRRVKVNKPQLAGRYLNHNTGCLLYSCARAGSRRLHVDNLSAASSLNLTPVPAGSLRHELKYGFRTEKEADSCRKDRKHTFTC